MSKIEKMATRIAAEMVEAYINHGSPIDEDYIAEKSCSIAYKIHERSKQYKKDNTLTKKDIERIAKNAVNIPSHHSE